jgi:hypothetical protein
MSNELTKSNTGELTIQTTSSSKCLAYIRKNEGENVVKLILSSAIDQLQTYFSLDRVMTPYQIQMTIDLIEETFYYFSPDDFRACFRGAMSGKYGKIYNRLDGAVIMEWLRMYDVEKTELVVQEQMQKKKELSAHDVMSTDSFNEAMKKLMAEIDAKNKRKEPEAYEPKQTPFEKQVIDEYYKLRGLNRFAVYQGKEMDFDTFRMIRYAEEIKNQGEL